MLAALPLVALTLLIPICRRISDTWRSAVLAASVVWGCAVVGITEGLGLLHAVNFGSVLACWVGLCAGLTVWNLVLPRSTNLEWPGGWRALTISLRGLLMATAIVAAVCLGIALVAPPNTVDSLTYHMTRVEHWIQNHSVAHYPTHVLRELHRTPWAEFGILHFQLLSGSDRFANLVQWLCMIGSLLGVSLIARELGADVRGQVLAVVVAGTIPMVILQASSTQTDLAGAYWIVCFVYFLIVLLDHRLSKRGNVAPLWLAGGSLGLALLTKSTSYLHAFAFLVWFGVAYWRKYRTQLLVAVLITAVSVGTLNAGYVLRNLGLFGTVFGPGGSEECAQCTLTNEAVTVPIFLSNVLRNTAGHLRMPNKELNAAITGFVRRAHESMGLDLADPRSTWKQIPFSLVPPRFDENTDGNPAHFLLIIWTGAVLLYRRQHFSTSAQAYAAVLLGAYVLLCLVVKWGPPNIRYQLGLFILWAPLSGLALAKLARRGMAETIGIVLIILAIPWLVLNAYRPLVGDRTILNSPREAQFFLYPPARAYEESFMGVSQFLEENHCRRIGVIRGQDDWEYPLWVLLRKDSPETVRIDEVEVANVSKAASAVTAAQEPEHCATVTIRETAVMATVRSASKRPDSTGKNSLSDLLR